MLQNYIFSGNPAILFNKHPDLFSETSFHVPSLPEWHSPSPFQLDSLRSDSWCKFRGSLKRFSRMTEYHYFCSVER